MAFVRSIGRWTMTALVINCIIGGGIFGLPSELTRLLGRASPIAMIFSALCMAVIMAPITEVASQFSQPGGPYLYVRTAFGSFLGTQIGWFHLLSDIGAIAALANLFVGYLGTFLPGPVNTGQRSALMAILIVIPALANYCGVRTGAILSNVTTLAKLLPLAVLILFGVARFATQPQVIHASEIVAPGFSNWMRALVLLVFAIGGWEGALIPAGEIKEPRRIIPFGLIAGLIACAAIYMLLQFITVATIGTATTDRPLADTASVLLGHGGTAFVSIAIMISTYGWISAALLYDPRLLYSLAAQGDLPSVFARLHPRLHTPAVAIFFYAFLAWVLASSGTFLWIVALASGFMTIYYAGACACLIPLRRLRPTADALRVPMGPFMSILGFAICLGLMSGLKRAEVFLMCIIAVIAGLNWLWAKRHRAELETRLKAAATL